MCIMEILFSALPQPISVPGLQCNFPANAFEDYLTLCKISCSDELMFICTFVIRQTFSLGTGATLFSLVFLSQKKFHTLFYVLCML